jgi:hypothetical protein
MLTSSLGMSLHNIPQCDLHELNKVVLRKQYPPPIIHDIVKKRAGYSFFTKIDISIQYYTFELDEESKNLTMIVMLFGKYRYNVLPMGLKCSPDIAQETMENIFHNVEDAEVYKNDTNAPKMHSSTLGSTI